MAEYESIDFLDVKKNIQLVKDKSTGKIYVKKYISTEQCRIYDLIRTRGYHGIPKVIDLYPEQDYYVLIEEYIKGQSLQKMLDDGIIFPPQFMLPLVSFLSKTLSQIHRDKLIHRDITPANIIYSGGRKFYLVDFGNSRIHKQSQSTDTEFVGTYHYAAPEQFGFGQSSRRTDIFAIGVLMNVLTTGKFPNEEMPRGRLRHVIKRCTAVNPIRRFWSVRTLLLAVWRAAYWPFTAMPILILEFYCTIGIWLILIFSL